MELNPSLIPQNQKELLTEKLRKSADEWPVIAKKFIIELDVSMNGQSQEDEEFDGDLLPSGLRTLNASNGIEEELNKYRAFPGYEYHKCR
jgi:phosphodiesterase/alkaline phosphatase D-like protein